MKCRVTEWAEPKCHWGDGISPCQCFKPQENISLDQLLYFFILFGIWQQMPWNSLHFIWQFSPKYQQLSKKGGLGHKTLVFCKSLSSCVKWTLPCASEQSLWAANHSEGKGRGLITQELRLLPNLCQAPAFCPHLGTPLLSIPPKNISSRIRVTTDRLSPNQNLKTLDWVNVMLLEDKRNANSLYPAWPMREDRRWKGKGSILRCPQQAGSSVPSLFFLHVWRRKLHTATNPARAELSSRLLFFPCRKRQKK